MSIMELKGSSRTPISIWTWPRVSQVTLCCTGAAPRARVELRTRMESRNETAMAMMARELLTLGRFQVVKTIITAAKTGMTGISQTMSSITRGTLPLPFHQIDFVQVDLGDAAVTGQ